MYFLAYYCCDNFKKRVNSENMCYYCSFFSFFLFWSLNNNYFEMTRGNRIIFT
uniref:Uncharacterized protein n=1 Tax=Anguilla anguilla TaxID=7936 RepID=A0A0E9XDN6_ANGAN